MKCRECNGSGDAEIIQGWARPCDACYGTGETASAIEAETAETLGSVHESAARQGDAQ